MCRLTILIVNDSCPGCRFNASRHLQLRSDRRGVLSDVLQGAVWTEFMVNLEQCTVKGQHAEQSEQKVAQLHVLRLSNASAFRCLRESILTGAFRWAKASICEAPFLHQVEPASPPILAGFVGVQGKFI